MEPELAVRARARDPRASHAADRRVQCTHRRHARLARPLLHGQGPRRLAPRARARGGRAQRDRGWLASIPRSFPGIAWTSYVATVVTSGLFTVVAALCVLWLALRGASRRKPRCLRPPPTASPRPRGATRRSSWATALTAGCLMLAFAAAIALARRRPRPSAAARLAWLIGLSAGLGGRHGISGGRAGARSSSVSRSLNATRRGPRDAPAVSAARIVAGGAAMRGAFCWPTTPLAFGSPFHLGYASEEGFEQLQTGFFGITYPQWWRVREILVGSYRGLLPLAPLVALTPIGLVVLAATARRQRAAVVAAAIAALLSPAERVVFLLGRRLGVRAAPDDARAALSRARPGAAVGFVDAASAGLVLVAGWIWGAALTLVAVSTTPQPPASFKSPVRSCCWPAFRDGDLSLNQQTFVHISRSGSCCAAERFRTPRGTSARSRACTDMPACCRLAVIWVGASGVLAQRAWSPSRTDSAAAGPRQFGNLEANLRFIEATGVVRAFERGARNRRRHGRAAARTLLDRAVERRASRSTAN